MSDLKSNIPDFAVELSKVFIPVKTGTDKNKQMKSWSDSLYKGYIHLRGKPIPDTSERLKVILRSSCDKVTTQDFQPILYRLAKYLKVGLEPCKDGYKVDGFKNRVWVFLVHYDFLNTEVNNALTRLKNRKVKKESDPKAIELSLKVLKAAYIKNLRNILLTLIFKTS